MQSTLNVKFKSNFILGDRIVDSIYFDWEIPVLFLLLFPKNVCIRELNAKKKVGKKFIGGGNTLFGCRE